MSVTLAPENLPQPALHSFISGVGDRATAAALAELRIGLPLRLRRVAKPVRGFSIEITTEAGAALGWLPREDEEALEALGVLPETAAVRLVAIDGRDRKAEGEDGVRLGQGDRIVDVEAMIPRLGLVLHRRDAGTERAEVATGRAGRRRVLDVGERALDRPTHPHAIDRARLVHRRQVADLQA